MQTLPSLSYVHLKEQLETWKKQQPSDTSRSHQQFRHLAENTLLPELKKLAAILREAGMDCEIFQDDTDAPGIGIRIEALQAMIGLSPGEQASCIRAVMAQDGRPNKQMEWFIPYHLLRTGGLERELQAALLQLLKPPRAA